MPETESKPAPTFQHFQRHEFKPPRPRGNCTTCGCDLAECNGTLQVRAKEGAGQFCDGCRPERQPWQES